MLPNESVYPLACFNSNDPQFHQQIYLSNTRLLLSLLQPFEPQTEHNMDDDSHVSISQEICTWFCVAVLCCGYTLTDFPISTRLTSLALWHLTIAPVPAKQPWWIWINNSCEFIMNDCITTTKQSTTKPCAYFLVYTVSLVEYHGIPTQS